MSTKDDSAKHELDVNLGSDLRGVTPRIDVQELFAGGREAILVYNGHDYRLRITSNARLILTK